MLTASRRASLALLGVVGGLCLPACADAAARLGGPSGVGPGHRATFLATGLSRGVEVTGLFLQPTRHRGASGYGQFIDQRHVAGRRGRVRLHVTWPRTYFICGGAGHCRRHGWSHRQRVDVYLQTAGDSHPRTTVRVLLARRT